MENEELFKRLNEFYIYANEGFYIDKVFKEDGCVIAYSSKVKDLDCNYITNLECQNKEEFIAKNKTIAEKMKFLNRKVCYIISPSNWYFYNNRKEIFDKMDFKEVGNEVWQVFTDYKNLENIETNCNLNVNLEKVTDMDMEKFAMMNDECFNTGDKDDPYGDCDKGYIDIYKNYKENDSSKYKREFFFIKVDGQIAGITVSVYGDNICGIYGLAIKKEYRGKGIGKEVLKKQIQLSKEKNCEIAFLQTEDGFYPAKMYRNFGFIDICNVYYYLKNE